ncbi:UDP-N-acetylglucosamine transferase subunit ALG13 [Murinocardiopsis flavida]|uniref:UDP-N-acetylglucosamine transferase subunit ALG13 n=1 Tax=Murinocardiopsis flavida TaxID=645275 RepID=A0A2P8DMC1_9ACTN|nr:glycosyltransferase [Murinocardiopsis flavida]PSK98355.1 UDP-N-acetylglucosamine transferase subunit ALG13 [Murinocardiopsis flavida]
MTEPNGAPAPDDRPLVLVTIGTNHHPFGRLVDWADHYARRHPRVRVLIQHGRTRPPVSAEAAAYLDRDRLAALMDEAAAVVTHGGHASITAARRAGRLPIAVARDPELGEHVDDHQLRFVTRLDDAGVVRSCASSQQFAATLDTALTRPGGFRVGGVPDPGAAVRRAVDLTDLHAAPRARSTAQRPLPPAGSFGPPWPEVTVVVPTRGRPDLLRTALRGITVQDYPGRITTLVVHDHEEPDHTLSDDNGDRPVLVLRNTLSPGLAGARNTGVLAADTELVAFCDDDDEWLPQKLRAQVEVMRAEPDTELVSCGITAVHQGGTTPRVLNRTTVGFGDLLRSNTTPLHPSTFLLRRDALVHGCGLVSEEIPGSYGHDYELLLRLAQRAPVRNIPVAAVRVLRHRHPHGDGRWRSVSIALRWLLSEYPEFRLVPAGHARIAGRIAFAEAASGRRAPALEWAVAALRRRPFEGRGYLALAVACGVPAGTVLRTLHRIGRGP